MGTSIHAFIEIDYAENDNPFGAEKKTGQVRLVAPPRMKGTGAFIFPSNDRMHAPRPYPGPVAGPPVPIPAELPPPPGRCHPCCNEGVV